MYNILTLKWIYISCIKNQHQSIIYTEPYYGIRCSIDTNLSAIDDISADHNEFEFEWNATT